MCSLEELKAITGDIARITVTRNKLSCTLTEARDFCIKSKTDWAERLYSEITKKATTHSGYISTHDRICAIIHNEYSNGKTADSAEKTIQQIAAIVGLQKLVA